MDTRFRMIYAKVLSCLEMTLTHLRPRSSLFIASSWEKSISPKVGFILLCFYITHFTADEEPLLKETRRRFVLFPIQFPEVCYIHILYTQCSSRVWIDLDNVQKSYGIILDRGGDRPLQRHS